MTNIESIHLQKELLQMEKSAEINSSISISANQVKLEDTWKRVLIDEFSKPYFLSIKKFIITEIEKGNRVYPPGRLIFHAFNKTPFNKLKVVILGQDPYHGQGQAHGLCFSVPDGVHAPPSLVNIFKEIKAEFGIKIPVSGNLESWAGQGVFLLNAMLTVNAHQPASHRDAGWQCFTDQVIKIISDLKQNVVFLLWGKFAGQKAELIDRSKHLILRAPHPSPFSAHRGFFGCNHFKETNIYLENHGLKPINWAIS